MPHINRTVGRMQKAHKPGMEIPVQAKEETGESKSVRQSRTRLCGAKKVMKYAGCVRESRYCFYMCPYRKPTRVDEERILRMADGRSIVKRLSKMTPVTSGEGATEMAAERIGSSNCLKKHRLANRKVKRRRAARPPGAGRR